MAGSHGNAGPLLDVPAQNPNKPDHEVKEIYAYGSSLRSPNAIVGLSKFTNLQSLSLHGNQIERIEGLEALRQLITLNLSSNNITRMEGLSQLKTLRVLNLASNRIREISGVHGLIALKTLVLSHNGIALLGGLSALHGPQYSLQHLDLRDNIVEYLCELWVLAGCLHLEEIILSLGVHTNPVCKERAYKSTLLSAVPRLQNLDGKPLEGHITTPAAEAVSVPPLPIWALQHCYPPSETPANLEPVAVPSHWNAQKGAIHPSRNTPEEQSQYNYPFGVVRRLPYNSHPANVHLQTQHCTKPLWKSPSKDPHRDQSQYQNPEGIWVHPYDPHSVNGQLQSQLRINTQWNSLSKDAFSQSAQSQPMWNPSSQIDTRLSGDQPDRISSDENSMCHYSKVLPKCPMHSKFEPLVTPNLDDNILEKKMMQGELPSKESENHEARLKRLEVRVLDLVGQLAKAKSGVLKVSGAETRGQSGCGREKDDESSDPSTESLQNGSTTYRNRYVRFVDRKNKLVPAQKDATVRAFKESAVQTESLVEPLLERLCQEVSQLQGELAHIATKREESVLLKLFESNAKTEIQRSQYKAKAELDKKEIEIFKLIEGRRSLEDEISASKLMLAHERERWQLEDERKTSAIKSLDLKLKEYEVEVQKIKDGAAHNERQLMAERSQVAAGIRSKAEAKLSAMNSEIVALKEALDFASNARQGSEKALSDAVCEKERARQTSATLTKALEEQCTKLKIAEEELVVCGRQEKNRREECSRLLAELDKVRKDLKECENFKLEKEREAKEVVEREAASWEAQGWAKSEREMGRARDKLQAQLSITQSELCQALQENGKHTQSIKKLREDTQKEVTELKEAFEAMREKERGAEELVTELTDVVRAQKLRLQKVQHDLDRLAASEQEVERLQGEVNRLQENARAAEVMSSRFEVLQQELANVSTVAERERCCLEKAARVQCSSLKEENKKLASDAAVFAHKLQETEDVVRVKSKMLDSQNDTIRHLKSELVEGKDAARVSVTAIKALEVDLSARLDEEVEQNRVLQIELTAQEDTIADMEMELKIMKGAKTAAENACKTLQQKVKDMDSMLRYVEEEINRVKALYEGREKTIMVQRDEALQELKLVRKKMEEAGTAAAAAMRAHFETTKAMEAQEKKTTAALLEKDIAIAESSRRVLEVEADMHSQVLALERQKAISTAKVNQLGKVLEELREAT